MNWHNRGTYTELLKLARAAAIDSYCPYSKMPVGAACLCLDARGRHEYSVGCDIECAARAVHMCAERVALFKAVAAGYRDLVALAISHPDLDEEDDPARRMPCGCCRQVFVEFGTASTIILVEGTGNFRLDELLPRAHRFPEH